MSSTYDIKKNKSNIQDLHYKSAAELVAALANREISSVELLEASISRIEQLDKKINAVVVRDFERAREAAKVADAAIARGERRPLLGLPMTVKESFNVAGLPTSWGNVQYKDWRADADALAVARLKAAGAIIIGKTNVPLMLKDWQAFNEIYGTTNNPRDVNRTPGGSSGGAAAALAAGFTSLELGSDMAGSLRTPAHYCGVYAHRPSLNLVPTRGGGPPNVQPLPDRTNDFAVAGPMARTANDLALALEIMAGPDELLNGKGYQLSLPPARHNNLSDFRVLVIDSHPLCPTAHVVKSSIDDLANRLVKLGVTVSRDMQIVPDLKKLAQNYAVLLTSFAAGSMPIEAYKELEATAKTLDADDDSLKAYFLRGIVLTHRDWLIATRIRKQMREEWRKLFNKFDVILYPAMPTPAFLHDHSPMKERKIDIDGTKIPYSTQHVWPSIASLFGLPSTVMPINHTEAGLPIGIQIMGDYLEDYTTITFAKLVEREFGGFIAPLPFS